MIEAEVKTEEVRSRGIGRLPDRLLRASYGLGGVCLLAAMAGDAAGVVARHLGLQLVGVIEGVQLCIVGIISSAIVAATAAGSHAAVHLLTSRLKGAARRALERLDDGLSALLFALVAAGDLWILAELAPLGERSDLLHLPIAPARTLWCVSLLLAAALSIAAVLSRRPIAASGTADYEP